MNLRSFLLRIRRRGGARYARGIRAALRVAREAGLLDDAQKRVMYAVEMRNLERLVLRADIQRPECYNSAQNAAFRDSCSSCCDAFVLHAQFFYWAIEYLLLSLMPKEPPFSTAGMGHAHTL